MSGSRFDHLELDEAVSPPPRESPAVRSGGGMFVSDPSHRLTTAVRDAPYHLAQAEKHLLAGDFEKALRSYSAALGQDPLALDAWVGQIQMLLELGECREASLWADKALESFPDNPRILSVKAVALHRMGLERQGRDLSDAALSGKGECPLVWLYRGALMLDGGRPAAESCFESALRLAGARRGMLQLHIGSFWLQHGEARQAVSALQEATRLHPASAWAWYLLGAARDALGFFEEARMCYRQAVGLAPDNALFRNAATAGKPGIVQRLRGFLSRLAAH